MIWEILSKSQAMNQPNHGAGSHADHRIRVSGDQL